MSVGLHLVVVAIMITSFVLVADTDALVAPDRIQIMEIDFNAVKVTGDETRLYNTNAPTAPIEKETPPAEPKPAPAPAPDAAEDTPLDTPSLVEDTPKEDKKSEPAPEKKTEDAPAPKKKTVVRVNREVLSLDRTLTVSVADALRVAMTRCWVVDTTRPDIADIRAVVRLTMRQNGTVRDVWFEGAARAETDPAFAYVLDTIRAAIDTCQPFRMLPPNEFDKWEKIQLTFYPTKGTVM